MSNLTDKYQGCLIGGAIGDALGYAVEFSSESDIFSRYGKSGITEYELQNGKAVVSDDTQMTMFTATALLDGITRGRLRGIMGSLTSYIGFEYEGWYLTQTKPFPIDIEENYAKYSWLMNMPEMFKRRAPGNTCLSALASGEKGTLDNPINNSKGCGGVMRVAPIGLYLAHFEHMTQEEIDTVGAEAAAITHGHELGYIPAAALVHIINMIVKNDNISVLQAVNDSISAMQGLFKNCTHIGYFTELMKKAVDLAQKECDDLAAIHRLGEGWVAEETLAIAAYCAIKYHDDFEKAVCTAVNHNGDGDSTGAVCGNIIGAYLGYKTIPQKYKANLEFHDVLLELAEDLFNDCQMSEYGENRDEKWMKKYVNRTYCMKA
ncbi:MAG TPA: hypothetical protein DDX91_07070 [Ruminococcaceae bacterium]|nr:hypothetical protein [Oscillospiraceae bacterium]